MVLLSELRPGTTFRTLENPPRTGRLVRLGASSATVEIIDPPARPRRFKTAEGVDVVIRNSRKPLTWSASVYVEKVEP